MLQDFYTVNQSHPRRTKRHSLSKCHSLLASCRRLVGGVVRDQELIRIDYNS